MMVNKKRTPIKMVMDLEIPAYARETLEKLLNEYGDSWHQELYDSSGDSWEINPDLLDSATGLAKTILPKKNQNSINEMLKNAARGFIGYEEFLDSISEIFEQDDDDSQADGSQKEFLLRDWRDCRIAHYQEVRKLGGLNARNQTYLDIEKLDLGGEKSACYTCGLIFYDNLFYLQRHIGIKKFYCSVDCESKAQFSCVVCGTEYIVGLPNASLHDELRVLKLGAICSKDCLSTYKLEKNRETRYIEGAKRRASKWKVEFDETITRKSVFEKTEGLCYLCGTATHLEHRGEGYQPDFATVDHKVAISKGGSHTWTNVANCCLRCNLIKHDSVY